MLIHAELIARSETEFAEADSTIRLSALGLL